MKETKKGAIYMKHSIVPGVSTWTDHWDAPNDALIQHDASSPVHSCTRAIPKVSGLDILDNNIFYNLYISETYILYKL